MPAEEAPDACAQDHRDIGGALWLHHPFLHRDPARLRQPSAEKGGLALEGRELATRTRMPFRIACAGRGLSWGTKWTTPP